MSATLRDAGTRALTLGVCALLIGCAPLSALRDVAFGPDITIYPAERIVTMDPALPMAHAIAIQEDRIVGVGDLASILAALGERNYEIDRRFEDKFLLPGLVEPHLHPYIAGILLPMKFITPHAWDLPGRSVPAVRGRENYLAALRAHERGLDDRGEWLWTWEFHSLFHGELSRADLDAISSERPILVWHRSFHEIYANTAALDALGVEQACAGAISARSPRTRGPSPSFAAWASATMASPCSRPACACPMANRFICG